MLWFALTVLILESSGSGNTSEKGLRRQGKNSHVGIVLMVDSREYRTQPDSLANSSSSFSLVAGINAKYASRKGYHFVWYKVLCPSGRGCSLDNSTRTRAPAWARIRAISETLSYYSVDYDQVSILYVDSDAYVSNHSTALFNFLQTAAIWEDGLSNQVCTGTMIWRNSAKALQILSDWWNFNQTYLYDEKRQWEQTVFNKYLIRKYRDDIYKLPSMGWVNYRKKIAWDNGLLYPSQRMVYFDSKYKLRHLYRQKYYSFIKHMWGGIINTNFKSLLIAFNALNASLLLESDFLECDINEAARNYYKRLCFKSRRG
jgi:hypothetical protein